MLIEPVSLLILTLSLQLPFLYREKIKSEELGDPGTAEPKELAVVGDESAQISTAPEPPVSINGVWVPVATI
jgi:hypothetical protein